MQLLSTLDCEVGICIIVSTNAIALESRVLLSSVAIAPEKPEGSNHENCHSTNWGRQQEVKCKGRMNCTCVHMPLALPILTDFVIPAHMVVLTCAVPLVPRNSPIISPLGTCIIVSTNTRLDCKSAVAQLSRLLQLLLTLDSEIGRTSWTSR